MKEKWVRINTIQGFEEIKDCYWISNSDEDKIMNKNTGKILKSCFDKGGYRRVGLRTIEGKKKMYNIHVMKAKAFIYTPNPLSYNVVRHLNDIKTDNRLENLAWGTQSDNIRDCVKNGNYNYEATAKNGAKNGKKGAKKTSKPVRCVETGVIYASTREVERKFGIDHVSISLCCRGKRHMAGGLHWTYVDKEMK